ncbi:DNA polymerase II [Candidatus Woesebacteria bacterium]|nr:DNA polymerase II [Candidatus Woesebacteria bacterium]
MEIDTSKMSKGKADAMEIAEAGRDKLNKTFAGGLYNGDVNFKDIFPFPEQNDHQKKEGQNFRVDLRGVFADHINPDWIDEHGEIPEPVFENLAKIGAFAIKVPKKYGGRGLSQTNYSKAAMICGSKCGNISALLSAHQSIGVPQPLLMYGTEEQKQKYLPMFANGSISAFALTENLVGSDPSQMQTEASPSDDGGSFILNGEKLWCTNGTKADVIVVMAKTPDKNGKKQITAFIVETNTPGVEVVTRCRFMGLRALYNGIIRFNQVRVPKENIILGEGRGMKVALGTLNIGRLTLPAICVGAIKEALRICREWGASRSQWGQPIGKHAAIADKIATIAADTFAMESMVLLTGQMADSKNHDIRVESAVAKMWGTEAAWKAIDDTMQVRGGRGYETVQSLKNRDEDPIPVERPFRDLRVNLIFEGSSEIMRLILAREALDPHIKAAGAALDSRLPIKKRIMGAMKALWFYTKWYPKQWLPISHGLPKGIHPSFKKKLKYVSKTSRKLARKLFHAMVIHGPSLDKQQLLLARLSEIGAELFVISASISRAQSLLEEQDKKDLLNLVDCIFNNSKIKINQKFRGLKSNNDKNNYSLAKKVLKGDYESLEKIV